jgi:uncharacterized membrane protein (UPF0127 family)
MRNSIKTLICALTLTSSIAFADDKMKTTDINDVLPQSTPNVESAAPERKNDNPATQTSYSPEQKAAIVELKLETVQKSK